MSVVIWHGDCLNVLASFEPDSIDACVTDPPYALASISKRYRVGQAPTLHPVYARITKGFMGSKWDTDIAFLPETWRAVWRVLKPGAHLVAFGGTRTYHRLACAIEDAGFEIRDQVAWMYGCLDTETEVLIDGRWERYDTATEGRLALCYSLERDEFAWQPIQRVVSYHHNATAYRLVGDHTDQLVTRDHRCIVERDGAFTFDRAETIARELQARVPVLEDVRALLDALPLPGSNAGGEEPALSGVRLGITQGSASSQADDRADRDGGADLCGVRGSVLASPVMGWPGEGAGASLLEDLQRAGSWPGLGDSRTQGQGGLDRGCRGPLATADDRIGEPCMEVRGDDLQDAWQLRRGPVCQGAEVGASDGAEGRLCDGTPAVRGGSHWALSAEDGGGTPPRPRPDEQCPVQPGAVRLEPGPQVVRASRFTSTDLVRVEPVQYDGAVWCLTVPTGAFVARRRGKVFVTGNSGFPKSLDISKAIDKAAGAEREIPRERYTCKRIKPGASVVAESAWGKQDISYTATDSVPATDAARQWGGWGTALKPAMEPICLARKPLSEPSVAANVLRHGTGGLHVDACRIEGTKPDTTRGAGGKNGRYGPLGAQKRVVDAGSGRWPTNVVLTHVHREWYSLRSDLSLEVAAVLRAVYGDVAEIPADMIPPGWEPYVIFSRVEQCREVGTRKVQGGVAVDRNRTGPKPSNVQCVPPSIPEPDVTYGDADGTETVYRWECVRGCPVQEMEAQSGERSSGSRVAGVRTGLGYHGAAGDGGPALNGSIGGASRFFPTFAYGPDESSAPFRYIPKADSAERSLGLGSRNRHATVKPVDLMAWLLRLVTPPGGTVLDPFFGSGTTGVAALGLGFSCVGIEQDAEWVETARGRIGMFAEVRTIPTPDPEHDAPPY